MTIHRIGTFPEQEIGGFMPTEDGPAVQINFPDNAQGWRRVVAAEGDLSGVQPDTIKYLLEITAANGTTSGVARDVNLYSYDVQYGTLTWLHKINGLPNSNTPNLNYAEAFWVNVAGGYYTFELNLNVYVIGLADGAVWGSSASGSTNGLSEIGGCYLIVPHPTNINIFNLLYRVGVNAYIRQVTVDSVNKNVSWGTGVSIAFSNNSWVGIWAIPDTRPTGTPGNYIIGRRALDNSGNYFRHYLSLNPTTGVATSFSNYITGYTFGSILLMEGDVLLTGWHTNNIQYLTFNLSVPGSLVVLPSWGTAGYNLKYGMCPYFDPTGQFGKYLVFSDSNTAVRLTRVPWVNLGAGVFENLLFNANIVISGFTLSGSITSPYFLTKPIIPCKYGFFYVGQMNTTGTAGPVIWYPLKPNLP